MTSIVALLGIAVAAMGLLGVVRPGDLMRIVENVWATRTGFHVAIAVRLALGAVLIAAAPDCRFPVAVRVIGVISVVGAAVVAVMGRERLRAFVRWWMAFPAGIIRSWAAFAFAFGAFLVYAAL